MAGVGNLPLKRFLNEMFRQRPDIPLYCLVDMDLGGINNFVGMTVGTYSNIHYNNDYYSPELRHIGITPGDVQRFRIETCAYTPILSIPILADHETIKKIVNDIKRHGKRADVVKISSSAECRKLKPGTEPILNFYNYKITNNEYINLNLNNTKTKEDKKKTILNMCKNTTKEQIQEITNFLDDNFNLNADNKKNLFNENTYIFLNYDTRSFTIQKTT